MTDRFRPFTTVANVVIWQDKFLIVEEKINGETVYNQPAGHLEENESLTTACERETTEETGIATKTQSLVGIYQFKASDGKNFVRFTFHSVVNQYGTTLEPPVTRPQDPQIIAAHWLTLEQIEALEDKLRSPLILQSIKDYYSGKSASLKTLSDEYM
ncbi:MAG: NUDIX hydrolase [Parashewanella sp.]